MGSMKHNLLNHLATRENAVWENASIPISTVEKTSENSI